MSLLTKITTVVLREVTEPNIKAINEMVSSADFTLDLIEESAASAKFLAIWCQKVDTYLQNYVICRDTVFKLEGLRVKLGEINIKMSMMEKEMDKIQAALGEEFQKQTLAQSDVDSAKGELEESAERAAQCKQLVQHLTLHFTIWEQSFKKLEDKSIIIGGNSILAASSLEYLSILDKELRRLTKNQWQKILSGNYVKFSTNFRIEKFVGNQLELYNWRLAGLPESGLNLENALVMKMTQRPKLVFDPNDTCLEWLKKYGVSSQREVSITSLKDKDQAKKLQICLEKGGLLIVDFFDGEVTGLVASLLEKIVRENEGQKTIKVEDMWYNFDEKFDFILLTRDATVMKIKEMQLQCCIINFSLDSVGLHQSLASLIASIFNPELEKQHLENLKSQLQKRAYLANNQDNILKRLILNSDEILLEDLEYQEMLEKFSETASFLGKEGTDKDKDKPEEEERSAQTYLLTLLVDCYLMLERFAEWEGLLKLSANSYLKIVERCIMRANIGKIENLTKEGNLVILRDVFNSVAGGVSREIRLFMAVDLCVIVLKLYSQFRQDLWTYIITSNSKKKERENTGDIELELADSLWKKLQNLRSMIPEIEMEQLPVLIQTFKQAPVIGVEEAMKDALSKTVELSSLERLAMYVSFIPENFNLCLEIFAEDVLPGSRWKSFSVVDGLELISYDQPIIFLPQGSCDYALLTENIKQRFNSNPFILHCGNSTWQKVSATLDRAANNGYIVVLSEFNLNKSLHESVCRYMREIKTRPRVNQDFRLAIILPPDNKNIPVELSNMSIKLLEQFDESTGDTLDAVYSQVDREALSQTSTKQQNMCLNTLLAFFAIKRRSFFGDQAFLGPLKPTELDLKALVDLLNEVGRLKLHSTASDLVFMEQATFTMFFGGVSNAVDDGVLKWFWHQGFIGEQKPAIVLR